MFETFTWSNVVAFSSGFLIRLEHYGLPHPVKLYNTQHELYIGAA